VPVDDRRHYWYAIFTSFGAPVNKDEMRRQRLALYELPDYRPRKNKRNDYGFDPHEQEHETFTGMGVDINVHDQWACESMGEIADRTEEHLGRSDKAISAYRRLLRSAIDTVEQGGKPPMIFDAAAVAEMIGPPAVDGIGPAEDWRGYWQMVEAGKRRSASWINGR
jgi:phthalate 4,5-dioxygenase